MDRRLHEGRELGVQVYPQIPQVGPTGESGESLQHPKYLPIGS